MTSQSLRDARKYEETLEKLISAEERPEFHLSTRVGWLNDPNGFSYYQGKYHMFYQYHPYSPYWGPMHWGHAVSEDLFHWEYLPAALAPDELYDQDGCFSGSAIELADGRQLLMYTAELLVPGINGRKQECQRQCVAVGDGVDYTKYEKNPVLTAENLPEGCSKIDFRDPKVFQTSDGKYACVVGNRPADGSGQILLFESDDCFEWRFKSVLAKNENRFGKMWECPDFFELDGKWVILTSPQDMVRQGTEYFNGNGTLCLIGDYDEEQGKFIEGYDQTIDSGIDFYAPQTVLSPDGRRIMIGWMQNWDSSKQHNPDTKWFGQMTIPRELSIKENRLYQWPIRELEALRKEKVEFRNLLVDQELTLEGIAGRKLDMELEISPEEGEDLFEKFALRFAQNERYYTELSFSPKSETVLLDREYAGSARAFVHQRECKVPGSGNGKLSLRVILDRFSVEVFINNGRNVMTATIYTQQDATMITFDCLGKARLNVTKYEICK